MSVHGGSACHWKAEGAERCELRAEGWDVASIPILDCALDVAAAPMDDALLAYVLGYI